MRAVTVSRPAGLCVLAACLLLEAVPAATSPPDSTCTVPPEQGGVLFPVDKLDAQTRCRIGAVVNNYTTSGLIGPVQSPVTPELYEYLLNRPPLIASLTDRLGLGAYEFHDRGPNQYWVNDGEGTQGLLTLVYQDPTHRIYHIDGFHEGQVFPMVRAKAAVFMHLTPVTTPEGHSVVQTSLMAYTKLDGSILAGLVRVLRPLIGEAVTRKLSRGFDVTNQLGAAIAQDRDRVVQQASLVPWLTTADLQTLIGWLHTIPQRPAAAPADPPKPPIQESP